MIATFAYMDLETADAQTQSLIQSAREELIFSKSWVADGVSGRILDSDGNIIEELPSFSDIFPANWNIPTDKSLRIQYTTNTEPVGYQPLATDNNWQLIYEDIVTLRYPSSTQNTAPFRTVSTTSFKGTPYEYSYKSIVTIGYCLGYSSTYNIGYSNAATGKSLGYAVNLASGTYFEIDPPKNITLAIRASSYDNRTLDWHMRVDGNVIEFEDY